MQSYFLFRSSSFQHIFLHPPTPPVRYINVFIIPPICCPLTLFWSLLATHKRLFYHVHPLLLYSILQPCPILSVFPCSFWLPPSTSIGATNLRCVLITSSPCLNEVWTLCFFYFNKHRLEYVLSKQNFACQAILHFCDEYRCARVDKVRVTNSALQWLWSLFRAHQDEKRRWNWCWKHLPLLTFRLKIDPFKNSLVKTSDWTERPYAPQKKLDSPLPIPSVNFIRLAFFIFLIVKGVLVKKPKQQLQIPKQDNHNIKII